jgi:diguanylate cyclase (GGDEF)-like protein
MFNYELTKAIYFLFFVFLFTLLSFIKKREKEKIEEEKEKLVSKVRIFDIEKVSQERAIKELREPLYPDTPAPLFRFALNHLKEVYLDLISPNSFAVLFYDPSFDGFRIEVSFSNKKNFKKKGVIPSYSSLIKYGLQKKERIYFPEFTGSGLDIGFYESDISIGSVCLIPIFAEKDLYGFIYTDKEEIRGFSEEDLKLLDYLTKEISIFLKFFFLSRDEHLLAARFRALFELAKETAGKLSLKEVSKKILDIVLVLKECDVCALFEKDEEFIKCVKVSNEVDWLKEGTVFYEDEESIISLLFKSGFPVITGKIKSNIPVIGKFNPGIRSIIAFPLKIDGKIRFALALFSKYTDYFDDRDKEIFSFLTQQAQVSLEKSILFEKTLELAVRDSLTGLYNHRVFQEHLSKFIERSLPFALIMIDVDHFKKINDTYGHPFGDKVLQKIGNILKKEIERNGIAARYGGEEFAVIIEGPKEYAQFKAEEIRRRIEKEEFFTDEGEPIKVTISLGISAFPGDGKDKNMLIDRADRALYIAKKRGRNRSIAWAQEEMGLF